MCSSVKAFCSSRTTTTTPIRSSSQMIGMLSIER